MEWGRLKSGLIALAGTALTVIAIVFGPIILILAGMAILTWGITGWVTYYN